MMLAYKFVRLIESRSETLAEGLLAKVRNSVFLCEYDKVPPDELRTRVYEIYRHLGEWLLGRKEKELERRYVEIGVRRAAQGVPLSQLTLAIILTKENLWEFLQHESGMERPIEVFGHLELLELLEQFFDRAIHSAAKGYEQFHSTQPVERLTAVR